jgi:hypothetical protein
MNRFDNRSKLRNRDFNAAINIPQPLKTALEREQKPAYRIPVFAQMKRKQSQKKRANAGIDNDGKRLKRERVHPFHFTLTLASSLRTR